MDKALAKSCDCTRRDYYINHFFSSVVGMVSGYLAWYLPAAFPIGMYWPIAVVSIPGFIIGLICDKCNVLYLLSLFLSLVVIFLIKVDEMGPLIFFMAVIYLLVFFGAIIFLSLGVFVRGFLRD